MFVTAGLWSNPSEIPRLPDEEEIGGKMNLVGPGGLSGYGVVEDTGMFGPGRSSGFGQIDDDMSNDGLGQAITPFRGGEMQGGPSPSGPISFFGNTRRMGHGDDLSLGGGGGRRVGGPKGWGAEGWGAQIFTLFFLLPAPIFILFFSLRVSSRAFLSLSNPLLIIECISLTFPT